MRSRITYTEKIVMLTGVILLLVFLTYNFTIRLTVSKIQSCANWEKQLVNFKDINTDLATQDSILKIIQNELREKIVKESDSEISLSTEIDNVMKYAGIMEYRFKRNREIGYHHALMITYELRLKMTFPEITKLLTQLETRITTSRITSIEMVKVKTQPRADQMMLATISFQQIGEEEE
ncbi:MAG: hypothetical protein IH948_08190 [Bacteroidetes bacterium]|nr:hypothetical protein [Bacteroidota bacterium]